ncbi:MAG: hypothetical protein N3D20_02255 [Candidatus Pacearchaeota archaeon]|nr:hypothetical protein [Candidatus Pacearchaeota archaeon]
MKKINCGCVLAAQCMRCGGVFDMGYDLGREEYETTNKKERGKESMLCWECRN